MKIGSARNLMMFNFTGLSFLVHIARASSAGRVGAWVPSLQATPTPIDDKDAYATGERRMLLVLHIAYKNGRSRSSAGERFAETATSHKLMPRRGSTTPFLEKHELRCSPSDFCHPI